MKSFALILLGIFSATSFASEKRESFSQTFLKSHIVKFGSTDYYVDMWKTNDTFLCSLTDLGFTNLHTLYIDSHGGDFNGIYCMTPHKSRCKRFITPTYSIENLAKGFSDEDKANIHNFYLGACNERSTFHSSEVIKYFPNVTNVVYVMSGRCYRITTLQAIITPMDGIEANLWFEGRRALPLMSDMFIKGENKPYLTKIASREILYPNQRLVVHDISQIFKK